VFQKIQLKRVVVIFKQSDIMCMLINIYINSWNSLLALTTKLTNSTPVPEFKN